jgi:hypothetical protein
VRLVTRLRELYGADAPIALHHNFDQSPLDVAALPPGVAVVHPHLPSGWGVWATVEAELAALRLLYGSGEGPDFVVLLSGADYPVAPPDRVLRDLRDGGADAYLHGSPVYVVRRDRGAVPGPLGFSVNEGPGNQKSCYRRYYPTIFRPFGIRVRIRNPLLAPLLTPFSRRLRCWAGEGWWTLGRRAALHLLAAPETLPALTDWFSRCRVPEEAYVHTIVRNAPGLRVDSRNFRYIDWRTPRPSPRDLGMADIPGIAASGAHFARKFVAGDPALDAIDAALGLSPWQGDPVAVGTSPRG